MANKPKANAADRPVMLSADSARRVGRMLSAYEGGDRAITPYVVPNNAIDGCAGRDVEDCEDMTLGCDDLKLIQGYDGAATQVLGHVAGCLQWIDTSNCP